MLETIPEISEYVLQSSTSRNEYIFLFFKNIRSAIWFFFSFTIKVEASLSQDDYGRDLASVQNLIKKHQLVEADIAAHEVSLVVKAFLF